MPGHGQDRIEILECYLPEAGLVSKATQSGRGYGKE